ncbi:hypothetical protein As57867_006002, partial [Aphanomyces stellatus]
MQHRHQTAWAAKLRMLELTRASHPRRHHDRNPTAAPPPHSFFNFTRPMKVALVLSVAAAVAQAKVSVGVLRALETSKTVTALIYYNQPSFDALPEASDRRQAVFDALTKHQEDAKTESASVLSSADCKEYYIASVSVCKGLTADDIKEIAKLPGVQSIGEDFTVQLDTPLKKAADGPLDTTVNQWGIETIGAPAAWKYFTGKGVVVGSIDTGAEYRHPAI